VTKSDRGEFLRDRAERFLRNARDLFAREEYDLAAFNLEQSSQLFLKHALWKKLGDFEKVHRISLLLEDFREVSKDKRAVDSFIAAHKEVIADLEMAYIESRYLPAQFFPEPVQKMIDFVEQLKGFIPGQ
jgi:HEPN domain-containing protein